MKPELERLSQIKSADILQPGDIHYKLGDVGTQIDRLATGASKLLENPDYWEIIPESTRRNLNDHVARILQFISELSNNKENTTWLTKNLEVYKQHIRGQYQELYRPLVIDIESFIYNKRSDIDKAAKQLNELIETTRKQLYEDKDRIESETQELKQSLSDQIEKGKEVTSGIAQVEASSFFEEVANGKDDDYKKYGRWLQAHAGRRKFKPVFLCRFYRWLCKLLANKYHQTKKHLFGKGYKYDAIRWLIFLISIITVTSIYTFLKFKDLTSDPEVELTNVLAVALILAAPAYLIRYSSRQYSTYRKMQMEYIHRAVVLKTANAYIDRPGVSPTVVEQVQVYAAVQAFSRPSAIEDTSSEIADTLIDLNSFNSLNKKG